MMLPPDQQPPAGDPGEQPDPKPKPENPRPRHNPHHHPHNPNHPALRRTVIRPTRPAPDPVDAAFVANRLTTLTHELSTLLDASLRVIGLARRSITEDRGPFRRDRDDRDPCPEQLARRLTTVDAAMRQMAELVRSTMVGMSEGGALGPRPGPTFGSSSSLAEAVRHAVDVMAPLADERCIQLDAEIAADLSEIAAGPIYAVITNGVRNAVESIQRVGHRFVGGRVLVRCWTEGGTTGRCVRLTIDDDGEGLPAQPKGLASRTASDASKDALPFSLGYTTKPGGSGIGLSLSRDVIEQLGGTITLVARPKDKHSGRSGATLSICYSVPDVPAVG